MMEGPDLFQVTKDDEIITTVWKPKLSGQLEIALNAKAQLISESVDNDELLNATKEMLQNIYGELSFVPSDSYLRKWKVD
jgi:hypothetical protein